jgi:hypothetical protein
MAFATLELVDGSVPLTVFPEPYRACSVALRYHGPVLVRGRVDDSDKGRVVLAEEVKPLDEATVAAARAQNGGTAMPRSAGNGAPTPAEVPSREATAHTCRVRVRPGATGADEMLAEVRRICESHPGSTPLFVHVLLADQEVVVRAKGLSVAAEAQLVAKVEGLLGPGSILVEYAGRA